MRVYEGFAKQFCIHGHDITIKGRAKTNSGCMECISKRNKAHLDKIRNITSGLKNKPCADCPNCHRLRTHNRGK